MSNKDHAKAAAHALTDLNTFAIVVTILEGGHIYTSGSQKAESRIIEICQAEVQRCLTDYDRAIEASH